MTRIRIDTEYAREVGRRIISEADCVAQIGNELRNAIGSLDTGAWDGRSRARAAPLLDRVRPENEWVKHQLEELGYKLVRVANIFEDKDQDVVKAITEIPWDWTLDPEKLPSSPETDVEETVEDQDLSLEDALDLLGDSLKTIDWVNDRTKAAKKFNEILKQIGRILNALTGKRGYVKRMEMLGDLLGGAKRVGGEIIDEIGTLLDLRDFAQYFNGEMTNQEIARTAVEVLIPIPFVDNIIADWMADNVPDPNGKWQGLVPKAGEPN